tara:strand:+ start:3999 stop:4310 length:312 start_codon:yes stop_codon:yes gene_type:complete
MMDRLDTLAIFVEVAEQRAPRGLLSLTVPVVGEFFSEVLSRSADAVAHARPQCVASGALVEVLDAFRPEDVPIHVIRPALLHVPAKMRAFIDRLVPALRAKFH